MVSVQVRMLVEHGLMPRPAACVRLTEPERAVLEARVRAGTTPARDVLRARIVLAACHDGTNVQIAAGLGVCPDTVSKWRRRFAAAGLEGLSDARRSGRPPLFTPVQVAQVKALACTLPADHGLPLSRWSAAELARHVVAEGSFQTVSTSSISRWLRACAIKPWQHRSWIFPRDPAFHAKAARVLDLYERRWDDRPLAGDEFVISADEKSQLQALRRRHSTRPATPERGMDVEFEYRRGGTLAYFAAYDVHQAEVFGRIEPKTGIEPFGRLVDQVMSQERYKNAKRVFWIVDNGSSHAGRASVDRMRAKYPNAVLIHLPVHASWLNQVECYFSILQRKAIAPADFANLDELAGRVLTFQDHYNQTAKPFDWKYSRADLLRDADRYTLAA
jgi:transposase